MARRRKPNDQDLDDQEATSTPEAAIGDAVDVNEGEDNNDTPGDPAPPGDEAAVSEPRPTALATSRRDLPCKLVEAEFASTAREMSEVIEQIEQEEADQDEQKAAMKERTKSLEAKLRRLATTLRRGAVERSVEVHTIADYEAGLARDVRQDTGEVIGSRHLTDRERQMPLDQVLPAHRVGDAMAVHSEAAEAEKK